MSPELPPALVPATAWLTIASPPMVISVQFGPRFPLARAKLSEEVTVAPALPGNATSGAIRQARISSLPERTRALCPGLVVALKTFPFPIAAYAEQTSNHRSLATL